MSVLLQNPSTWKQIRKAQKSEASMETVLPFLVLPVALVTLVKLFHYAHRRKNFIESLPFIIM